MLILRAFSSEWVKLRRRRLWFGAYGAIAGVVVLTTVVTIAGAASSAGHHPAGTLTLATLSRATGLSRGLTQSGVLLGAVALSIAAAQFGGEFSHGTLRNLLVRAPRRASLIVGNGLAVLSFLVGAVIVAAIVDIGAAVAMAQVRDVATGAWTTGSAMASLGQIVGDMALSVCGYAVVGMVLGVVLRSSVIAIGAGLALLLPIESIISSAVPSTARWLPGQLLDSLAQGGSAQASFGAALVTTSIYLAGIVVLALVAFTRRDVTT